MARTTIPASLWAGTVPCPRSQSACISNSGHPRRQGNCSECPTFSGSLSSRGRDSSRLPGAHSVDAWPGIRQGQEQRQETAPPRIFCVLKALARCPGAGFPDSGAGGRRTLETPFPTRTPGGGQRGKERELGTVHTVVQTGAWGHRSSSHPPRPLSPRLVTAQDVPGAPGTRVAG